MPRSSDFGASDRFLVESPLGEIVEMLIGFVLFVKGALEYFGDVIMTQFFRESHGGPVTGDFVVFDSLCRSD